VCYDTVAEFNVDSKAECGNLDLAYNVTKSKKYIQDGPKSKPQSFVHIFVKY